MAIQSWCCGQAPSPWGTDTPAANPGAQWPHLSWSLVSWKRCWAKTTAGLELTGRARRLLRYMSFSQYSDTCQGKREGPLSSSALTPQQEHLAHGEHWLHTGNPKGQLGHYTGPWTCFIHSFIHYTNTHWAPLMCWDLCAPAHHDSPPPLPHAISFLPSHLPILVDWCLLPVPCPSVCVSCSCLSPSLVP